MQDQLYVKGEGNFDEGDVSIISSLVPGRKGSFNSLKIRLKLQGVFISLIKELINHSCVQVLSSLGLFYQIVDPEKGKAPRSLDVGSLAT